MNKHFNRLTPGEAERLALVAEECAEAIQAIGKILRHGYESRNPNIPVSITNRAMLTKELGDICAVMDVICRAGDIDAATMHRYREGKHVKLKGYTHHQPHDLLKVTV